MTYILSINPGSTSTKIALFNEEVCLFEEVIRHSSNELDQFNHVQDQFAFRKESIEQCLEKKNFDSRKLSAIVGRGGLLPPVKSGAYYVNETMIDRLVNRPIAEHASNLGAVIAYAIAKPLGIPALIYDSVAVDELTAVARVTGLKDITRKSLFHALNSRAVAIDQAQSEGKEYSLVTYIVVHMGGGITLSLHHKGRVIDIISDDEGPFSPERAGRVPTRGLIELCYSEKYSMKEMLKKTRGQGGLKGLLGTTDMQEVEKMALNEHEDAKLFYEAMIYQIAKGIGELSVVVDGQIDKIILTGGIAYSKNITQLIAKKVSFIADVIVMPGENEMKALALGGLRVLRKQEIAHIYSE
ncbi:MAG: butyrate kinase [Eubacteriales bacterium]|nr:butyrate kinase [Eubacteriales bacterium]